MSCCPSLCKEAGAQRGPCLPSVLSVVLYSVHACTHCFSGARKKRISVYVKCFALDLTMLSHLLACEVFTLWHLMEVGYDKEGASTFAKNA